MSLYTPLARQCAELFKQTFAFSLATENSSGMMRSVFDISSRFYATDIFSQRRLK
ncbi:hypothetical protein L911_1199 [Vibrio fluvialis I21563]|nr:hypothetical protein L911_1199 [Vibrio fluvialis I21563]